LLCAFTGWNDAGEAASGALGYLRDLWRAELIGRCDPDLFVDYQMTRPVVHLDRGMTRRIEWPTMSLYHARPGRRDVLLFLGVEPNYRWRVFTSELIEVAREFDVNAIATFGAFLAGVPHTRPAPTSGAASDPELLVKIRLSPSRYEGPTGIVGVLHDAAGTAGIPSVSIWAAAPHYVASGPSPRATLALVEVFTRMLGQQIDLGPLEDTIPDWESRVSVAVQSDEGMAELVRGLEELRDDTDSDLDKDDIPTGEALAEELERYLRNRPSDD
jgi:proteasome assembly chaperone (PAC2) family protein